jgi:hypothetical protein
MVSVIAAPAAAIGHVLHVDPRHLLQQLAEQVLRRAVAAGGVAQRARLRAGECDQLRHGARRHLRIDHEDRGHDRHHRDRDQIAPRIEVQPEQAGIDRERPCRGQHEGVAIRRAARRVFGADRAADAGAVLDEHGLPQHGGQLLRHDARGEVRGTTGREGRDELDLPVRPFALCQRGPRHRRGRCAQHHASCRHRGLSLDDPRATLGNARAPRKDRAWKPAPGTRS